jgi:hypothetical protein
VGYQHTGKIIPANTTTVKNRSVIFAKENGIQKERKVNQLNDSGKSRPASARISDDIKALQAE